MSFCGLDGVHSCVHAYCIYDTISKKSNVPSFGMAVGVFNMCMEQCIARPASESPCAYYSL